MPAEGLRLVPSGTLAFGDEARQRGPAFGLAVVAPPSYPSSRSGNRNFEITRDHPELLLATFRVMCPDVTIFFSTNHQDLHLCFVS
jgi:23S rRNA G2069 N7-methylase RlmK/C1962 C5-methylase RlmI